MVSYQEQTVLILTAVFGAASVWVMIMRLAFRKSRGQGFFLSDYLTIAAIFCAVTRIAIVPVVILWHSNHDLAKQDLTGSESDRHEIAAKLLLANRLVYNT
jgi:hypothetical protein